MPAIKANKVCIVFDFLHKLTKLGNIFLNIKMFH